jgi:hypothetical protein
MHDPLTKLARMATTYRNQTIPLKELLALASDSGDATLRTMSGFRFCKLEGKSVIGNGIARFAPCCGVVVTNLDNRLSIGAQP